MSDPWSPRTLADSASAWSGSVTAREPTPTPLETNGASRTAATIQAQAPSAPNGALTTNTATKTAAGPAPLPTVGTFDRNKYGKGTPQREITKEEQKAMSARWGQWIVENTVPPEKRRQDAKSLEHLHRPWESKDSKGLTPLRFYGPGPGKRGSNEPPVGTLHYARWRHELATIDDPDGDAYWHEEACMKDTDGLHVRPTYVTKSGNPAREVNYFRWEMVTEDALRGKKVFPAQGVTRAVHDEYLLNSGDFNKIEAKRPTIAYDLDNRENEKLTAIYQLGYKLLKKFSKANGHAEWKEGQCLGPDPNNPHARTKHLGWMPTSLRKPKAGLGADPDDAIWKEIFHGNLNAKPAKEFVEPKPTWSECPTKVTALRTSTASSAPVFVLSLVALKSTLQSPEPESIAARNAWLSPRRPIEPSDGQKSYHVEVIKDTLTGAPMVIIGNRRDNMIRDANPADRKADDGCAFISKWIESVTISDGAMDVQLQKHEVYDRAGGRGNDVQKKANEVAKVESKPPVNTKRPQTINYYLPPHLRQKVNKVEVLPHLRKPEHPQAPVQHKANEASTTAGWLAPHLRKPEPRRPVLQDKKNESTTVTDWIPPHARPRQSALNGQNKAATLGNNQAASIKPKEEGGHMNTPAVSTETPAGFESVANEEMVQYGAKQHMPSEKLAGGESNGNKEDAMSKRGGNRPALGYNSFRSKYLARPEDY
ncbi:hypothetical protein GGS20DRAFT_587986 [Poronia punctata]|nr:hypothetical protein GGS20DRAFT_587986 [Poronia punctata]